jgi:hypothetical protein
LGLQIFSYAQQSTDQSQNVNYNISFENQTRNNSLYLLAEYIEDRLEKVSTILEFAAKLPEMRHTSFANMSDASINGISNNTDPEKRQMARLIISEYPEEFVSLLFMMPNGTVYMQEPFERQLNLTTPNLSQREYYKGVINTKEVFLSNVIISASNGLKQAPLAVPVFNNNNTSLVGILAGGLNFETFDKTLQSYYSDDQERVLLVDNNGVKIADSNRELSLRNETYADLQGFSNAINGQSGSIIETVYGAEMMVSYYPVEAVSKTWVILSLQPLNNNGL